MSDTPRHTRSDTSAKQERRRRHSNGTPLQAALAVVLALYLLVALPFAADSGNNVRCSGLRIAVSDTASLKFVTAAELSRELGDLPRKARGMKLIDIDTDSIERLLNAIDKIENASAVRLTDGTVFVSVSPMRPVARVFSRNGSYYINRAGKKIGADARYHVDVPVVQGEFDDSVFPATRLLPLIDYIGSDSLWSSLVSMIKVDSPRDVLLVPVVRGQIINFGTPDDFEDKFSRIRLMYSEVLPVKGWNYYDTLSVKWDGQIVATRRHKKLAEPRFAPDDEEETPDLSTMLAAEGVAPGQSLPGVKAKNEKPIPAAKNQPKAHAADKPKANKK